MMQPKAVVIHGKDDCTAALQPGLPVLLLSAERAGCYAGAGWWRALIAAGLRDCRRPDVEDALDCGDEPGRALEALATGCRMIILTPCPGFAAVAERVAGATILSVRPPALDLGQHGAARRLTAWLQGDSGTAFG